MHSQLIELIWLRLWDLRSLHHYFPHTLPCPMSQRSHRFSRPHRLQNYWRFVRLRLWDLRSLHHYFPQTLNFPMSQRTHLLLMQQMKMCWMHLQLIESKLHPFLVCLLHHCYHPLHPLVPRWQQIHLLWWQQMLHSLWKYLQRWS